MSSVSVLAVFVGFAFVAAGLTGKRLSGLLLGDWDQTPSLVGPPGSGSPYNPGQSPGSSAPPGWVTPTNPNRGGGVYTSYTPPQDSTPGNLIDLSTILPELV